MLLYTDPWKDDPYGKIQGEMVNVWSKLTFDEAKLYKHDDAYILAGYFHAPLLGVTRKFKPEDAINSGLMSVTIHSQDYQVRKKNDEGKYEVGIEFLESDAKARKALKKFMDTFHKNTNKEKI